MPFKIASEYAGITYFTFRNWCIKASLADPKDQAYIDFYEKVKKVKAETMYKWLDVVDSAMDEGQWQAAAWKLERRYYKYFGKSSDVMELAKKMDRIEKEIKDAAKRKDVEDGPITD